MEESENQRLKIIMNKLNFKKQIEFAEALGIKQGTLSDILRGKPGLGVSDSIKFKLENLYNVNLEWLKTGNGKLFLGKPTTGTGMINSTRRRLGNIPIKETPTIQRDFTGYYYPNINASAGLDFLTDNTDIEKIPITIPNWGKGLDFINVFGDSMYPKFASGEIIGIKQIEIEYLNYGYAYVVMLADGEVYLKYIKKGRDENHVILASENTNYDPKEFKLSMIKKVFIVKGVITKTTM